MIGFGDIFESLDPRDYDATQPNGLRRVKVVGITQMGGKTISVRIINLSTGRQSNVVAGYLESRRWKKV